MSLLARVPSGANTPLLFEWAPIMLSALRDGRAPEPSGRLLEWTKTGDPFGPVILAGMYAYTGDRERSLHWLRFAVDRGAVDEKWWNTTDPFVGSMRSDQEFAELIARARSIRIAYQTVVRLLPNER